MLGWRCCLILLLALFVERFYGLAWILVAAGWDCAAGCDFGERFEYEQAIGDSWVRDVEVRLVDDEVVEEEDVEVDCAWCPALAVVAFSAHASFDGEAEFEEGLRCPRGSDADDGVEVVAAGFDAGGVEGRGFDDGCDGDDGGLFVVVDVGDGCVDGGVSVAEV